MPILQTAEQLTVMSWIHSDERLEGDEEDRLVCHENALTTSPIIHLSLPAQSRVNFGVLPLFSASSGPSGTFPLSGITLQCQHPVLASDENA